MSYTSQKIFISLFCSIFIVIGAFMLGAPLVQYLETGVLNSYTMFIGIPFVLIGSFMMISKLRLINKFQQQTFAWYKQVNPGCVTAHQVVCNSCGGTHIQVRNLMNQTYHRAHLCVRCGTTLYYSPEK